MRMWVGIFEFSVKYIFKIAPKMAKRKKVVTKVLILKSNLASGRRIRGVRWATNQKES